VNVLTDALLESKSRKEASDIQKKMISGFKKRNVLPRVIKNLESRLDSIQKN